MSSLESYKSLLLEDPFNIIKIFQEINDYELCFEICNFACHLNGLVIEFIPEIYQSESLCKIAIDSNIKSMNYIKNLSFDCIEYAYNKYNFDIFMTINLQDCILDFLRIMEQKNLEEIEILKIKKKEKVRIEKEKRKAAKK